MKYIYLLLLSFSIVFSAENPEDNVLSESQLQSFLSGPSNVGTEFWLTIPPAYLEVPNPDNFIRIIVGAAKDANVRLSQEGGIDMSINVLGGSTNSFDLTPGYGQPYRHYSKETKGQPAQVWTDKALHIKSDEPVIVYVIIRYSFTSDGYLAIPVDGLGKKYVATNYDAREWVQNGSLPNMLCVVSPSDNTNVKFTLGGGTLAEVKVEINGGRVLTTGESNEFNMNQGDVLVISNVGADETLSGSLIEADKDVAVFSANFCADIPLRARACDYIVEQDLPIETWGLINAIPGFSYRDNPSILRIFAKEKETIVWRNGQEILYFTNGVGQTGGLQNEAWVETRIWPIGTVPKSAIYTSDKPIYISLYNPSMQDDGKSSDPFSMIISPVEQYQNEILFSTPSASGGKNFADNFLNIIYESDEDGFVPEDMMFGIIKNDTTTWRPLSQIFGANGEMIYRIGSLGDKDALLNSKYTGKRFAHKEIKLPGEGVYKIKSSSIFTGFSSGVDNFDTYGFPTTGMFKFNSEDLSQPVVNKIIDCNGNVNGDAFDVGENEDDYIGLSTPKVDFSNSSNFSNIYYQQENFKPGQKSIDWTMNVIDKEKPATAVVYFSDRSGNYVSETIEYVPSGISIPKPEIAYEGNLYLCDENSNLTLSIENKDYSRIEWSNGETTESIQVNKAGKYYVKVFDENDCFVTSDELNVLSAKEINLNISKSTLEEVICEGEEITLTADVDSEGEITWSNGETTKSIIVSQSGEYYYSFKMNDVDCEFNSDVYNIEFTPLPTKPEIIYDNFTLEVETNSSIIQWYIDGVISDEHKNKKVIAPDKNGNYSVEVFEETGNCSNTSDEYDVSWMSVEENISQEKIIISPNPNNGNFTLNIETELTGQVEFNVLDLNGKKVFTQKSLINSTNYSKDFKLPELSKGVYILNIKSNAKEINKKFIVE